MTSRTNIGNNKGGIVEQHKDTDAFWMVYVDGASLPKVKHYDKVKAMAEAERLARKEGKTAYVLFACGGYKLQEAPVLAFITGYV